MGHGLSHKQQEQARSGNVNKGQVTKQVMVMRQVRGQAGKLSRQVRIVKEHGKAWAWLQQSLLQYATCLLILFFLLSFCRMCWLSPEEDDRRLIHAKIAYCVPRTDF